MHLSKALTAKLAAAMLVVSALVTPTLAANVGTVTSDSGLNLRSQASTSSSVLSVLPYGTQVDVLSTTSDGAWHQVSYLGVTGYVSGDYLSVVAEKVYGQVVADALNIRTGPGTEYATCGSLSNGTVVEILDTIGGMGGWYKIAQGYVSTDYVAMVDASVVNGSAKGAAIAQYAKQFVGYPYVYGGSSPSGFDCSGFVTYVCNQNGISVNRTASAQMSNGTAVSKAQLQPGDLVFFNSGNSSKLATHVGIYLGNGQFVHASTPSTGVIISDLNSSYYTNTYVGARRLG
mgnify:CR=1 FL=1